MLDYGTLPKFLVSIHVFGNLTIIYNYTRQMIKDQ